MKKTFLSALLMFVFVLAFGQGRSDTQEMRTLFGGNDKISHGGYGAINVEYGQIDGQDAVLVGGRGGWIINHRLTLGLAGKGIATSQPFDYPQSNPDYEDKLYLNGGYGGLLIEPIIYPFSPIHVSFPIIIGAGGAAYGIQYKYSNDWEGTYWETIEASAFFICEPGVEINLNLVKFMRLSFGAYYRVTAGLTMTDPISGESAPKNLMDGFSTGISLKFGKF
jgi:hypothetical protein